MEVRIISISPKVNHPVQNVFKGAKFFQAVDLRSKSSQQLLDENLITLNGFENLKNGRKYHHELSTPGAIGLILSFLKILKSNNGPILICEDDCIPSPDLPKVIDEMLLNSSDFDMVVFGPIMYERPERPKSPMPSVFENFDTLKQYYWGNHALLFSPHGRQKAIEHLEGPYEIQLDALFSRLAMYSDYRVLIQASGPPLAKQAAHISTIQTLSSCPMCDTLPNELPSNLWSVILLILSFVFIFARQSECTDGCSDRFYCSKLKKIIKRKL
jgi:GR25 family glycosyltransferase involved in LPS biosynthesis